MTALPVSVIVVSHGRPEALVRCLMGLDQLDYPAFEIVVVADAAGIARLSPWDGRIKQVAFDEENISAARNLGIRAAAGEIVAFVDDDAVPEPDWLARLAGGFVNDEVVAAGGYVIGRNGFSYQWQARAAAADATTAPLEVTGDGPHLMHGKPGQAIKTEGTNMAFRREVLATMCGFDPVYRFYLDETDLNLRIAARGGVTAIVPRARVHHGFLESHRRRADRVPRSLFEIGASHAAFLRRHPHGQDALVLRKEEREKQRVRLLDHMVAGRLEPGDIGPLLDGFDAGWEEGAARPVMELAAIGPATAPFLPVAPRVTGGLTVLAGRTWQGRRLRAEAAARAAAGERVMLYLFAPSPRRHTRQFDPGGYWVQSGGLFGASDRSDPVFRAWSFTSRVARERERAPWTRSFAND